MREPFESEPEAFRFVLVTAAAFAVVAAASVLGGTWVAVTAWAVVTAATVLAYILRGRARPAPVARPHVGPADERRILVVENDVPAGRALVDEIERLRRGRRANILVVAPALTSSLRHWVSDVDGGVADARERLDSTAADLAAAGIEAQVQVGDDDPLEAIDDAFRTFGPDEIIIATSKSRFVDRARERYAVPITQV